MPKKQSKIIKNDIILPDNFKYGIMTFRDKTEVFKNTYLKIIRSGYENK